MGKETIHIAYTTNRNYLSFAAISCRSLMESNPDARFHIHVLGHELEPQDVDSIRTVIPKDRAELTVYPMERLREMLTIKVPDSFPLIAYARLFLASVLPNNVNRVIYLDGDTIIRGDIRPLYEAGLGDALVGGIIDPIASSEYKRRTGIANNEPYINAGVLVIPLDKWRKEKIEDRFVEHLRQCNGSVFLFDQGLVNAVCVGKKQLITPKYDLMTNYIAYPYKFLKKYNAPFYPKSIVQEAIDNPVVIHFTGRLYGRPWEDDCRHPYKEEFMHYKGLTPFKDLPVGHTNLDRFDRMSNWIYWHCPFFIYALYVKTFYLISHIKNTSIK